MSTQKPDLTRVWAATAPPANVVDPDTTTPGKVSAGWQAEVPPFEHFNFLQKWFTQGLAHFNEQGIAIWDVDTVYPEDAWVKGSDGNIYIAQSQQSGNDPTSSPNIWFKLIVDVTSSEPLVIVSTGQSNAAGVNSGGPNPANPNVFVWDGVTGDWGSSDYTQNPLARSNPDGNGGNNNIALALAHRLHDKTGRKVYVVYDAVGGTSIDEWVGSGTSSTRYAAIATKVVNALASPELSGKTTVDAIHWQQGEEDALTSDFADYYGKFQTLISQFRAETWVEEISPVLVGAPSQVLHERYEPKKAMRQFCNKDDAFAIWVNSAGLETSDSTHYTGDSLWEMGYYRMFQAWVSGPYLNEVDMPLFYGRGTGPARPDDRTQICSASSLVSWDSKTNEFPPNSNAATGSITWGFECDADGNYTFAGGYQVTTDNLCNYTFLWGRETNADANADYSGGFGFQNQLSAAYSFVAGRGHTVADDGGSAVGLFSLYTASELDPVIHQVGIGTSSGNRKNGITVRQSGTTEIYAPSTANDPTQDEEVVIKRVDNFTLRLSLRGTDSVVRSVDLTLS